MRIGVTHARWLNAKCRNNSGIDGAGSPFDADSKVSGEQKGFRIFGKNRIPHCISGLVSSATAEDDGFRGDAR